MSPAGKAGLQALKFESLLTTGMEYEPLVMTPPLFGPHCSYLKNGSKDPCSFCLKEWRADQS